MIDKSLEGRLIAECKASQGQYLPATHGKGSFATTYSEIFVSAASCLYKMYLSEGKQQALFRLGRTFREHGILSCRGATMTHDKVHYFFRTHIAPRVSGL